MAFCVEFFRRGTSDRIREPREFGNYNQRIDLVSLGLEEKIPEGVTVTSNDEETVVYVPPEYGDIWCGGASVASVKNEEERYDGSLRVTLNRLNDINAMLSLEPKGSNFEVFITPDLPESRRRVG